MSDLTPAERARLTASVAKTIWEIVNDIAGQSAWQWDGSLYMDEARVAIEEANLDAEAVAQVDPVRLQQAMREAHGKRGYTGETYAEAIARRYNANR